MAFDLNPSNVLQLLFRDANGKHASMKMYIDSGETDPSAGGAAAISAAAAALSDSALYETQILIVAEDSSAGPATSGDYDRPSDKALFRFNTADGTIVHQQIGAPLNTVFSNAWDVDALDSGVAAYIAAMITNCTTQEGAALIAFDGGNRRRPPRRKQQ